MKPESNECRGVTTPPKASQSTDLEKFILKEENKCHKTLEKLMRRLKESDSWILSDEIDLTVAQEKLNLLEQIKSICIKLNYIKD